MSNFKIQSAVRVQATEIPHNLVADAGQQLVSTLHQAEKKLGEFSAEMSALRKKLEHGSEAEKMCGDVKRKLEGLALDLRDIQDELER